METYFEENPRLLVDGGNFDLQIMDGDLKKHPSHSIMPQKLVELLKQLFASFGPIRVVMKYYRIVRIGVWNLENVISQAELDHAVFEKNREILDALRFVIPSFRVIRLSLSGTELVDGDYTGDISDNYVGLLVFSRPMDMTPSSIAALAETLESSSLAPSTVAESSQAEASTSLAADAMDATSASVKRAQPEHGEGGDGGPVKRRRNQAGSKPAPPEKLEFLLGQGAPIRFLPELQSMSSEVSIGSIGSTLGGAIYDSTTEDI